MPQTAITVLADCRSESHLCSNCSSQRQLKKSSGELARRALAHKLVVGMRAKKTWAMVDPQLLEIPCLKNPQCGAVSVGNAPESLFDEIVAALRKRRKIK